jgi:diguanylate cyclase (GGDEF)-like protein/PAS domain S-box-containing protein
MFSSPLKEAHFNLPDDISRAKNSPANLLAAQLNELSAREKASIPVGISAILVIALAHWGSVPLTNLIFWLVCMSVMQLVRFLLSRKNFSFDQDSINLLYWRNVRVLVSVVYGGIWGALFFLLDTGQPDFLFMFKFAAVAAGLGVMLNTLGVVLPVYIGFVAPIVLISSTFLIAETPYLLVNQRHSLLIGIVFYAVMLVLAARSLAKLTRRSCENRFEREAALVQLRENSTQLKTILDSMSEGLHGFSMDGKIIFENPAAITLLGGDLNEMIGQPAHRLIHSPETDGAPYPQSCCHIYETLNDGETRHIQDEAFWRKDGTSFPADYTSTPMRNSTGDIAGVIVSFRDITERKLAEENLLVTASVFENSQEAITITDEANNIIDVNPAFTRITGYGREEVLGRNPKILSSGRHDQTFYAQIWESLNKSKAWRGEIWNRSKSGEIYAEVLSISVICDNEGKVQRYVAVFSDISKAKAHEAELSRVAHYDGLTGIPNRVLLADRMKQAFAQTSREQNMMAICYLDLDGFKYINDTLGHEAGDVVLIEVARRIEKTIRGGDSVARLGGDEFAIMLLGLAQGEECVATLERLLAAIAQPVVVKGKPCSISASIGVSIYPLDDENPDTLLRHADQAMYIAKQSGKNRFHIYDPALDRRARDQHEFLKSIRHALKRNQFELYYQPKINLRTKELAGVEALIRWRHPERGLLSPAEFLRHIENTDLDIEIGEWVMATALAQMDNWRSTGLDIEVSINISGYHLESARFMEKLQRQLAQYPDLPPGKLQIEVLETVALNDIAIVREIIESCRKFGVGFALDDFGTGYSSLTYLSSLPVDVLKIDQSFVRDMLEDKGDMAIVQGIVALARAFELQTVAEGIETEGQYRALLDMGCEAGQGYGIARPMAADELINWQENCRL